MANNISKLSRYPVHIARWLGSHAAILFLLWSLWLAIAYFGFGPLSYVRIHDNGDGLLPSRLALLPALADSQLGYWNPQIVSGNDMLVGGGVVKFDSLLFMLLPGWLAYGLIMWLQRFVAGYFTFRLLKESLHLGTVPSLYAGFAYALFAQNTINDAWAGFTLTDGLALPGLPFVLWAMLWLDARRGYRPYLYAIGLGVLISFNSIFALAMFVMLGILFWFLFVMPRSSPKFWILLLLFAVGWVLGELPVLWATLLNAPLSPRAALIPIMYSPLSGGWLRQVSYCLGLVLDNAVPLGLASIGLIVTRGQERRLALLSGAIIFCLVFVLGYPLIQVIAHDYLGVLSSIQFDRVYFLVPFLATVSGGCGLHLIGRERRLALPRQTLNRYDLSLRTVLVAGAISLIGLQSLITTATILKDVAMGSNFTALYRQPDLQQLSEVKKGLPPFRVATIFDNYLHPAYVWAYGLESADGYSGVYSQRYQDYWEQVIAPLTNVEQARYEYFHYSKSRAYLFSPSEGFAPQREVRFRDYYDLELLSLANVRYIVSSLPLQDENLTLLPSNVRSTRLNCKVMSQRDKVLAMIRGECYQGVPLNIYENRRVLPRFFLVSQTRVFDEPAQALAALRQANYEDLQSTAYLERVDVTNVPLNLLDGRSGEVGLRSYSSDRITLDVSTESVSILIVTNNYSPYWNAWIDGAEVNVFPVDHAFQGVYVEGGEHQVMLKYAPPYAIRVGW